VLIEMVASFLTIMVEAGLELTVSSTTQPIVGQLNSEKIISGYRRSEYVS
jgi:hypothetical protein